MYSAKALNVFKMGPLNLLAPPHVQTYIYTKYKKKKLLQKKGMVVELFFLLDEHIEVFARRT